MKHVPDPLGELAESAKIKGHKKVGLQRLGASKTLQHWELPEDKNQAKKALKAGEVDVFVMSPIQFPDEGVENFVKFGLEHNPNMRFLVQITWGGGDIDNQDFPKGAFANVDREKTPDQLKKLYERNIKAAEAQADDINKKYGGGKKVLFLVPSAPALVALRTRIAHKEVPGLTKQGETNHHVFPKGDNAMKWYSSLCLCACSIVLAASLMAVAIGVSVSRVIMSPGVRPHSWPSTVFSSR
jgi:hypothetical protein